MYKSTHLHVVLPNANEVGGYKFRGKLEREYRVKILALHVADLV